MERAPGGSVRQQSHQQRSPGGGARPEHELHLGGTTRVQQAVLSRVGNWLGLGGGGVPVAAAGGRGSPAAARTSSPAAGRSRARRGRTREESPRPPSHSLPDNHYIHRS